MKLQILLYIIVYDEVVTFHSDESVKANAVLTCNNISTNAISGLIYGPFHIVCYNGFLTRLESTTKMEYYISQEIYKYTSYSLH
jgi:hypothetical protein